MENPAETEHVETAAEKEAPHAPERILCSEEMAARFLPHLEGHLGRLPKKPFLEVEPFPHLVIDDFLPDELCAQVESYGRSLEGLDENIHLNSKKLAANRYWEFDAEPRELLSFFYSEHFERFLSRVTGVEGVHADHRYNWGGGYHFLPKGGFLNVHKDFNIHPYTNEHRRLNAILYLNRGWRDQDGGQLELWDMERKERFASIVPIFNRLVIFETSEASYHGNPEKVVRDDQPRMSYSLYYYTAGRPDADEITQHTTVYVDRPGEYTNLLRKLTAPLKEVLPASLVEKLRAYLRK